MFANAEKKEYAIAARQRTQWSMEMLSPELFVDRCFRATEERIPAPVKKDI